MHVTDSFHNLSAPENDGKVNVRSAPHEPARHDPDDCVDPLVQAQFAPQHPRIATELPLPEAMAQDADGRRIRRPIRGSDRPAQEWRDPKNQEGIGRHVVPAEALRFSLSGPENVADGRGDHAFKNGGAFRNLQKLVGRVINPPPALSRIPDPYTHQAVDVFVWERIQDHAVDYAVHGGSRHDSQRQRENRDGCESRVLRQIANPETDVAQEFLTPERHRAFILAQVAASCLRRYIAYHQGTKTRTNTENLGFIVSRIKSRLWRGIYDHAVSKDDVARSE